MELNNIYKKISEIEIQTRKRFFNENILEYLEESYPEIKKAMDEENYVIEYPEFNFFIELKLEDKIVGFYTLEFNFDKSKVINEFYVIPEYRGNNLFIETMKLLSIIPNDVFLLRNPTRLLIEILIKNGLATKISENIVVSYVNFCLKVNECNLNNYIINNLYDNNLIFDFVFIPTNMYDFKYSTVITKDNFGILTKKKSTLMISNPRQQDIDKYNLKSILNEITEEYLEKTDNIICTTHQGEEFLINTANEFLDILTVDHIFGNEENLHEDMIELIKNTCYTKEEVITAIKKVETAWKNYEISPLGLITRFDYLLIHPTVNAVLTENKKLKDNTCPYCYSMRSDNETICNFCGFDFNDDEEVFQDIEDLEGEIDPETGLEYYFLEEIIEKGYDPKEIYEEQLELATNSFLIEMDENPSYEFMPIFELDFYISEDDVLTYLKTNKLVEEKVNKNYDENYINRPINEELNYNIIDEYVYKITKKGRRHYKKNKICSNFIKTFNEMDYHDFKLYCAKNSGKKIHKIVEEYINTKISESLKNEDKELYLKMCESEEKLIKDPEKEESKITVLKNFICNENNKILEDYSDKEELSMLIQLKLVLVVELSTKKELKNLYDKAYDSITYDELKIRKKENWEKLERYIREDLPQLKEEIGI